MTKGDGSVYYSSYRHVEAMARGKRSARAGRWRKRYNQARRVPNWSRPAERFASFGTMTLMNWPLHTSPSRKWIPARAGIFVGLLFRGDRPYYQKSSIGKCERHGRKLSIGCCGLPVAVSRGRCSRFWRGALIAGSGPESADPLRGCANGAHERRCNRRRVHRRQWRRWR